jgi:hypothetical protein
MGGYRYFGGTCWLHLKGLNTVLGSKIASFMQAGYKESDHDIRGEGVQVCEPIGKM